MASTLRYFNELRQWSLVDVNDINGSAWTTYTPVVSSEVGTITSYTASGRYQQLGKIVFITINIVIVDNGTGASAVNVTLPIPANITLNQALVGFENGTSGKSLHGGIGPASGHGASSAFIRAYDNTYPANTGSTLNLSGTYEAA